MRSGFTTGSCAAAAAKAAAYMLLFGTEKKTIQITTPKGPVYEPEILEIERKQDVVSCAVKKDAGDDPDATNGALVYAEVSIINRTEEGDITVTIDGGIGVGRVTKPGLDQPVGNAAINHVPREMITNEVTQVLESADFHGEVQVIISIPEGVEIAKNTFNPRLGIEGGISVLGTNIGPWNQRRGGADEHAGDPGHDQSGTPSASRLWLFMCGSLSGQLWRRLYEGDVWLRSG